MRQNYDYCYLDESGMLRYMPMILRDGDSYRVNPPQEVYASHGGYKKTATPPEAVEGSYWAENEPKDWAWDKETMTVRVTYREENIPMSEPMPRRWSRLSVIRGCKAAGLWGEFKAMLESEDMFDELIGADYLAEDDENFVAMIDAARKRFGEDAVEALINSLPTEA